MHPGQTSLAEAVHREGIRIFAQLSRASTAAVSAVTGPGFTGRYCRQSAGKRKRPARWRSGWAAVATGGRQYPRGLRGGLPDSGTKRRRSDRRGAGHLPQPSCTTLMGQIEDLTKRISEPEPSIRPNDRQNLPAVRPDAFLCTAGLLYCIQSIRKGLRWRETGNRPISAETVFCRTFSLPVTRYRLRRPSSCCPPSSSM